MQAILYNTFVSGDELSLPEQISSKFARVKSARCSRKMFYYVYILQSTKDNKLYSVYTADLKRRVDDHNKGKVKATKNRTPFKLIYYEAYRHQQDATAREKYFKTQWGRNYLRKVLKNYWVAVMDD